MLIESTHTCVHRRCRTMPFSLIYENRLPIINNMNEHLGPSSISNQMKLMKTFVFLVYSIDRLLSTNDNNNDDADRRLRHRWSLFGLCTILYSALIRGAGNPSMSHNNQIIFINEMLTIEQLDCCEYVLTFWVFVRYI